MARARTTRPISDAWPAGLECDVRHRLQDGARIRRTLPAHGRLHIDRPLPFLCISRHAGPGVPGEAARLVTSEASYLICPARAGLHGHLAKLVEVVATELVEQFGACLIVEVWEGPASSADEEIPINALVPGFRIVAARGASDDRVTSSIESALSRVRVGRNAAQVAQTSAAKNCAPGTRPLMKAADARRLGCCLYGLEVDPVYRSPVTGDAFPRVLRQLRRGLTIALRRAFFDFARAQTTHRPAHYHALGRRAVVKAVWQVDAILAEACEQFDFLLQISPVNTEQAWREFKRHKYGRAPTLHYRPVPTDPVELKRQLYKAPIERIEDPALGLLFREKVYEVDRQITMLQDLNTSRCVSESLQLYGGVEDKLLDEARQIMMSIPPRSSERAPKGRVRATDVAKTAHQELAMLRKQDASLAAGVDIRDDIAGLIVSRGNLLIGSGLRVPESRLQALIQHEVGTHIVTHHNGRQQPFRQLYTGLAGYDQLQEGVAVLGEYLAGGLSRPRVRVLAARVIAVYCLLDGASFVDTYRILVDQYGVISRVAFDVAVRVYRGGGFTKDAIYLRGFRQVLDFVGQGGDLRDLMVGKIGVDHIPLIRELRWRGVLKAPAILPRYLTDSGTADRVEELRRSTSILDLVKRRKQ